MSYGVAPSAERQTEGNGSATLLSKEYAFGINPSLYPIKKAENNVLRSYTKVVIILF